MAEQPGTAPPRFIRGIPLHYSCLGRRRSSRARWLSAVYALNPPSIIRLAPVM
jgi:hypothetical protein